MPKAITEALKMANITLLVIGCFVGFWLVLYNAILIVRVYTHHAQHPHKKNPK